MTDNNNSIVNMGDFSKPADTLIKKISSAFGILYEPYRIKNMARAEIEVAKIKRQGEIEISQIEQKAFDRLLEQEVRKQNNIDEIILQAINQLPSDAAVEGLEEDWVAHFFNQCDTVSDTQMQSMWASLLAQEATKPGSYSKRTVNLISVLDKRDADLFTNLCSFVWHMDSAYPLIFSPHEEIYRARGINFAALQHLESLGLIHFDTDGYALRDIKSEIKLRYNSSHFTIKLRPPEDQFFVGVASFTLAGQELYSLCHAVRDEIYYEDILKKFAGMNYIVSPFIPE